MANKILITEIDGTPPQITFADFAGDFSPTAANDLRHASATDTEVQISLASLADGSARQSDKVDLGENRAPSYSVRAAFEIVDSPTAGAVIELYWAPSQHATAGTGNPGAVGGSDGAYSGYDSNLGASVRQLLHIGNFVCTGDDSSTIQVAEVGEFSPPSRYGTLVVKNESGAALHGDDVEIHVVFDPTLPELQ